MPQIENMPLPRHQSANALRLSACHIFAGQQSYRIEITLNDNVFTEQPKIQLSFNTNCTHPGQAAASL